MRIRPVAFAAVLVLTAVASAADEKPVHDLAAPEKWTVGETVTWTTKEAVTMTASGDVGGRAIPAQTQIVRADASIVVRCDSTDDAGALASATVHFADWSVEAQGRDDRSLAGAVVTAGATGWSLVSATGTPSAGARAWLDREFGAGWQKRGAFAAEIAPGKPVALGDGWASDTSTVASGLFAMIGLPAKLATQEGKAALEAPVSEEEGVAPRAGVSVVLQGESKLVDTGAFGKELTVSPESTAAITRRVTLVPGAAHKTQFASDSAAIDLVATGKNRDVVITMKMKGRILRSRDTAAGGTIPETKAAPGAVRIAAHAAWKAGDAYTEVGRERRDLVRTPIGSDGKDMDAEKSDDLVEWTVVARCTETTEAGEPAALTVEVQKWHALVDGAPDDSLAGAVFESKGGRWKIVREGATAPSDRAKGWIASRYSTKSIEDPMRAAVRPAAPVAAGETWSPLGDDVIAASRAWMPVPMGGGAKAEAKLVSADAKAGTASIAYSATIPVECVEGCGCSNVEDLQEGVLTVKGTCDGAADAWDRSGSIDETCTLNVTVPAEGGGTQRLAVTRVRTRTRTPLAAPRE